MPSTEAMLMTENQAMRIPGTLSTSPGDDWGPCRPRETRSACVNCKSWRSFVGKVTQKTGSMPVLYRYILLVARFK